MVGLLVCYSTNLVLFIIVAIPAPVINVIAIGTGVIGDSYSAVCSVDVDDNLYNIVVNSTIVKIGVGVVTSTVTSGDNSVSISYTPLMASHSGQYHCLVNISQIDISYQVSYIETFTINTTSKFIISLMLYYVVSNHVNNS